MTQLYYEYDGVLHATDFDVIASEVVVGTAEATEYPVERGVDRSDNVSPKPYRVSLEAMVTNTPIRPSVAGVSPAPLIGSRGPLALTGYDVRQARVVEVKGGKLGIKLPGRQRQMTPITVTGGGRVSAPVAVSVDTLQFPERMNRPRRTYETLLALMENGIVCTVDTDLREFPSMAITSVSAPRRAEDSYIFSIELVEYVTATLSVVQVRRRARKVADKRAAAPVEDGPKGKGWDAAPDAPVDLVSIARRIEDRLLGIDRSGG